MFGLPFDDGALSANLFEALGHWNKSFISPYARLSEIIARCCYHRPPFGVGGLARDFVGVGGASCGGH
jgi:hypothetical protein